LYHQQTIRRFLAFIMLLLFVTSITPKRFLHHWFANHKDVAVQVANHQDQAQLHKDGIHCDCNHLVATSPFTHISTVIDWAAPVYHGRAITPAVCDTYSTTSTVCSLRGPPSGA
jgi:hypothetical protein